jgi:D-galacturonate reductase
MKRGDVCIVFTPDDTHFGIASAAITAGLHVLMAKPMVKQLAQHRELMELAAKAGVLVRSES